MARCAISAAHNRSQATLAAERQALDLGAAIRNHLVDVHVELRAAAAHPHMQGEHVAMAADEDLVADLGNQPMLLVPQAPLVVIGLRRRPLHDRVGGNHLARHEIAADVEVLDRAMRLSAPKLALENFDRTEAVGLRAAI